MKEFQPPVSGLSDMCVKLFFYIGKNNPVVVAERGPCVQVLIIGKGFQATTSSAYRKIMAGVADLCQVIGSFCGVEEDGRVANILKRLVQESPAAELAKLVEPAAGEDAAVWVDTHEMLRALIGERTFFQRVAEEKETEYLSEGVYNNICFGG